MASFNYQSLTSLYIEALYQIEFLEAKLRELKNSVQYGQGYIPFNYPIGFVLSGLLNVRATYVAMVDQQMLNK